ncbi:MAG: hypothetical protein RL693_1680 [Verrucomicrobiota bacterium]|jgi:hypothetical protein
MKVAITLRVMSPYLKPHTECEDYFAEISLPKPACLSYTMTDLQCSTPTPESN